MDQSSKLSLGLSVLALLVSVVTGYFQYQTRQDAVVEDIVIEVKMTLDRRQLNPQDLRIMSGVEDRTKLKTAVLVTNVGLTPVHLLEVGYVDFDQPEYFFHSQGNAPKMLLPGEQALFPARDLVQIKQQLTRDLTLGAEQTARLFATSTKRKRFEVPAILKVAQ